SPAYVIAWSCWRRAHQAAARRAHLKLKCNCSAREDRARADRTRLCGGPATIYPVATCAAFSDVQEGPWQ
ncbi:hypothetical protein CN118_35855, partial [Sinorhizobium meliloti]